MKYFTSDLHFGHLNAIKYRPKRLQYIQEWCNKNNVALTDDNVNDCMTNWLIDVWNSTVTKSDDVYVIGDFSLYSKTKTIEVLSKLKGKKHLIVGNHDKSSKNLTGYFTDISQIKYVKHTDNNGVEYEFILCHYPLLKWARMEYGVKHLHGHTHGDIDYLNDNDSSERVDIGIDGRFADYKLLSVDNVIEYFKKN